MYPPGPDLHSSGVFYWKKIDSQIEIIEMILWHLGLWDIRNHDPPPPAQVYPELIYDDSDTQIPAFDYWS